MEQVLLVEIDRCWGCKVCQVACKQAHQTPPGPGGVEVQAVEGPGAEPSCDYIPVMCQHCSDASCAKACPRGAIKRGAAGEQLIDDALCIGCGLCVRACPFGAVYLRPDTGRAEKCDLCAVRRAQGLVPACAQHCLGRAITLCDVEEVRRRTAGRHVWSMGRVVYVSEQVIFPTKGYV